MRRHGASIAPGYTPGTFGGKPPTPQPLKGQGRRYGYEQKGKRKTAIVTMRLPPETKARLQTMAQDAHMTLTDYLCICGLGQQIVQIEGLEPLLSEVKAQGRNLNQLVTLANMGRVRVARGDELVDSYVRLCSELERITGEVQ